MAKKKSASSLISELKRKTRRNYNSEEKIGTMLPCNVIVQEFEVGVIEVAAVNPMASMQAVENEKLEKIANEISNKLKTVINKL